MADIRSFYPVTKKLKQNTPDDIPRSFKHIDETPRKAVFVSRIDSFSNNVEGPRTPEKLWSPLVPHLSQGEGFPSDRTLAEKSSLKMAQSKAASEPPKTLIQTCNYRDPVQKLIELEEPLQRIMNTPQFQRLHFLKQLGTSDYVYRGATHTRFQHSLGVAHLAGRLVGNLRQCQPYLEITQEDCLCVKIAGLCHDLGHGPYSHLFDGPFMSAARKGARVNGKKWKHEIGSVMMLDYLLEDNSIDLSLYNLNDQDLTFIKEMILGVPPNDRKGRPASKEFLYDIVNNTRSGLDVDKLDYFQRDVEATGVCGNKCFDRFIDLARVNLADDDNNEEHLMICYPEKMLGETVEVFKTRFDLHRLVYQHKTTVAVELMIVDALISANEHFRIRGKKTDKHPDGLYKLSESIDDMEVYMKMKDSSLLDLIENDRTEGGLDEARAIIARINKRELYKCCGIAPIPPNFDLRREDILHDLGKELQSSFMDTSQEDDFEVLTQTDDNDATHFDEDGEMALLTQRGAGDLDDPLTIDELRVTIQTIHSGQKTENPVAKARFFKKTAEFGKDKAYEIDESKYEYMLPKYFQMKNVRLYCTSMNPKKQNKAAQLLIQWTRNLGSASPLQLSQG